MFASAKPSGFVGSGSTCVHADGPHVDPPVLGPFSHPAYVSCLISDVFGGEPSD
jgi:hypothetical protein